MADVLSATREPRSHRSRSLPLGLLCALEILVLGPLAALLVLWVIPSAFEIEWACVGASGVLHQAGDSYAAGFGVAGTFGWIAVVVGAIFASIAEVRWLPVVLPLAWFLALVAGSLVAAASIGPQPC